MSGDLDIHPASAGEREQALANLHDVWGRGLDAEEHRRWRLQNPKHENARWYVGVLDQRVVSGCGVYDFELRVDGRLHRACALGEVHTLAEFRGRGFAPRLLARVEEHQRSLGRTAALLYSDIATAYYERLGYAACPSPEGWCDPREPAPGDLPAGDELAPFDPTRELDAMADLYAGHHAGMALAVERSRLYWEHLIARSPNDAFLWLRDAAGRRLGYARLAITPGELRIRDLALADRAEASPGRLLGAVRALGAARGVRRAGGWLPATAASRALFALGPRRSEITMLKSLDPGLVLEPRHHAAAEHFHEIDHV